jgi:hypothetical protein
LEFLENNGHFEGLSEDAKEDRLFKAVFAVLEGRRAKMLEKGETAKDNQSQHIRLRPELQEVILAIWEVLEKNGKLDGLDEDGKFSKVLKVTDKYLKIKKQRLIEKGLLKEDASDEPANPNP